MVGKFTVSWREGVIVIACFHFDLLGTIGQLNVCNTIIYTN